LFSLVCVFDAKKTYAIGEEFAEEVRDILLRKLKLLETLAKDPDLIQCLKKANR